MEGATNAVVFPLLGILASGKVSVVDEVFAATVEELAKANVIGNIAGARYTNELLHVELGTSVIARGIERPRDSSGQFEGERWGWTADVAFVAAVVPIVLSWRVLQQDIGGKV